MRVTVEPRRLEIACPYCEHQFGTLVHDINDHDAIEECQYCGITFVCEVRVEVVCTPVALVGKEKEAAAAVEARKVAARGPRAA